MQKLKLIQFTFKIVNSYKIQYSAKWIWPEIVVQRCMYFIAFYNFNITIEEDVHTRSVFRANVNITINSALTETTSCLAVNVRVLH